MLRRILFQVVIASYLCVTLSGFLYATLRMRLPFVPEQLLQWSYRSMAPWQGFMTRHRELIAVARFADGTTEEVPLAPYFPFRAGQRMVMQEFASFENTDARNAAYDAFARHVLSVEQKNHAYVSLELRRISWPMSPEGRDALNKDAYRTTELLTDVP